MIKTLVADDHAVVREGLKQILSATDDIVVAYEASTGREALNEAIKHNYHVVILDITMPGGNILDIIKQLKISKPEQKILILTMHPEEQYAIRVLKAGASGYLTKDKASDELIRAIRKVSAGGR